MKIIYFKRRKYTVVLSFFLGFLMSCGEKGKSKELSPNVLPNETEISIDTFSVFPSEIDGCACYFYNTKSEFENNKYIYADNSDSLAFVSINGKMLKFFFRKSNTLPGDRLVWVYSNDQYEITIDIKEIGQIDETWQKEGTLKLKAKNSKELIKKIYGECGC